MAGWSAYGSEGSEGVTLSLVDAEAPQLFSSVFKEREGGREKGRKEGRKGGREGGRKGGREGGREISCSFQGPSLDTVAGESGWTGISL